jgi:hypothetical protein
MRLMLPLLKFHPSRFLSLNMLPKFKQRPLTMRAFAILFALAIGWLTPTAADGGDDFTNNLFTDLAPCVYSGSHSYKRC